MKSLFLTGYRLSVSAKNTRLVFKQRINDPFRKEKEKQDFIELPTLAALLIKGLCKVGEICFKGGSADIGREGN
jgi:hypothetical protein